MKKIYSHENIVLVHNMKNLLEGRGITVFVNNAFAQGAVGELAAFDAWPELCLQDERDYPQAQKLVATAKAVGQGPDWVCAHCAEVNAASFELCWQCQQARL